MKSHDTTKQNSQKKSKKWKSRFKVLHK
jgi:hypothetical protein